MEDEEGCLGHRSNLEGGLAAIRAQRLASP